MRSGLSKEIYIDEQHATFKQTEENMQSSATAAEISNRRTGGSLDAQGQQVVKRMAT